MWLSRRAAAAPLAVLFAATASARYLLWDLFGAENVDAVLSRPAGFAGFLFQSAWVPQHIISAALVMVAIYLIAQLAHRRNALTVVMLGLVAAAGFESSTWIGGFAFAASALVAVPLLLFADRAQRALALSRCARRRGDHCGGGRRAVPARPARRGGRAQHGIADCGDAARRVRRSRSRLAAPPARSAGVLAGVPARRARGDLHPGRDGAGGVPAPAAISMPDRRRAVLALAALAAASLTISWLLASTLADNNDLGWRAVLPAAMALTVLSAAGLARWIAARAWTAIAVTAAAILVGLPGAVELIRSDVAGRREADAKLFAQTPEMWAAVRRHAGPDERIANNPLFLADMTLWPVDISWALLADRRSCYAGRELALVYASLPRPRLDEIDAQFIRVFAGKRRAGRRRRPRHEVRLPAGGAHLRGRRLGERSVRGATRATGSSRRSRARGGFTGDCGEGSTDEPIHHRHRRACPGGPRSYLHRMCHGQAEWSRTSPAMTTIASDGCAAPQIPLNQLKPSLP